MPLRVFENEQELEAFLNLIRNPANYAPFPDAMGRETQAMDPGQQTASSGEQPGTFSFFLFYGTGKMDMDIQGGHRGD